MENQLVDFESFFHQLIPFTEQDHRIMYGGMQQGLFPDTSTPFPIQEVSNSSTQSQFLELSNFTPEVVVKQETKSKENASPPSVSTSPVGDELDDGERQKARRANQNLACRNYRRRKKEYVSELEGRIHKLEEENDQLRKENSTFKKGEQMDAIDPNGISIMLEMKQILERLDDAVKNNLDERSISYLLQIFFLATEKRHIIHEKEVDKLVDPLTQAKLATMGYVPSLENPMIAQLYGPSGLEWWELYIKEAGITPEQAEKMQEMRERLWKVDGELRLERSMIDKQIKEFYLQKLKLIPSLTCDTSKQSTFKNGSTMDMAEVIEFSRQLNCLKKNFIAQRTMVLEIQCQLTKILQPRQHAILMLKINQSRAFDWPRHVQTLKSAWQLFSDKQQNFTNNPSAVLNLLSATENLQAGTTPSLTTPIVASSTAQIHPMTHQNSTHNVSIPMHVPNSVPTANIIINGNVQNTFIQHPLQQQAPQSRSQPPQQLSQQQLQQLQHLQLQQQQQLHQLQLQQQLQQQHKTQPQTQQKQSQQQQQIQPQQPMPTIQQIQPQQLQQQADSPTNNGNYTQQQPQTSQPQTLLHSHQNLVTSLPPGDYTSEN